MDPVIEFLLTNLSKLSTIPAEVWVMMGLLQIVFIFVIWAIIHHLYSTSNTVNTSAIQVYKDLTESINVDREKLQQQKKELLDLQDEYMQNQTSAKVTNKLLSQNTYNLKLIHLYLSQFYLLNSFLNTLLFMLVIYRAVDAEKHPGSPKTIDLYKELDAIHETIESSFKAIDTPEITNTQNNTQLIEVPKELNSLNLDTINSDLKTIHKKINTEFNRVFDRN